MYPILHGDAVRILLYNTSIARIILNLLLRLLRLVSGRGSTFAGLMAIHRALCSRCQEVTLPQAPMHLHTLRSTMQMLNVGERSRASAKFACVTARYATVRSAIIFGVAGSTRDLRASPRADPRTGVWCCACFLGIINGDVGCIQSVHRVWIIYIATVVQLWMDI